MHPQAQCMQLMKSSPYTRHGSFRTYFQWGSQADVAHCNLGLPVGATPTFLYQKEEKCQLVQVADKTCPESNWDNIQFELVSCLKNLWVSTPAGGAARKKPYYSGSGGS